MTIKIYNEHPYASEYMAKVVAAGSDKLGDYIVLSQTIFYPEGGGQPCDLGTINGIDVKDVQTVDGEIRHYTTEPILDEEVDLSINYDRRFVLMQNHLGQHIFSSVIEKLYSGNTVGFHIGDEYVTVDIDKKLSREDINEAERFANQIIMSNLTVKVHYPTDHELSEMPLRKQPKFTENIRVIEIDNFDFSPCGGTHPTKTSEVNLLKVRKLENYKSGVRIEFVCGGWAHKDFKNKNEWIYTLATDFSVKPNEVVESVKRIKDENTALKKQLRDMANQLATFKVESLRTGAEDVNGISFIKSIDDTLTMDSIRNIGTQLTKDSERTICLLTNGNQILISSSKDTNLKIGTFFREIIVAEGGKGGGNDYAAQGALNTACPQMIIDSLYQKINETSN